MRRVVVPLTLLALVALAGCVSMLTRPEGDGGWSPEERQRQLERLARASGVDLDAQPPPVTAASDAMPDAAPTPAGAASHDESALTLNDALARAATGNRHLAEARAQLALARQRVWEARGRLFPSTVGRGRYTWNTSAQRNAVPIPNISPQPSFPIRDQNIGTISGVLTMPVDLSGELRYTLAAAQAGYRGEAARLWAATLDTDVVVIGAYYNLLEAERLRDVTRQTIALHRQQLSFADDRFRNGRLTKNEVLVVQVALRNSEQELRQRELAIDEGRFALNQAVGLPIDAPTTVVDVAERPALPAEAEALRVAYRNNPALVALIEDQQRLDATTSALARSRLPRFSGGGTVDDSDSKILAPTLIGAGFVGFEWDLGTDTRREADIAAARIAGDENRVRTERELRELEQAVRSTYRAAAERLAALDTSELAVQQAEENVRIRQQQFDVGRATSDDVLDAEALLAQERAGAATARYEAHTRRAELQQLMGQSLDALAKGR
ncbi:MAG TPA: TolC family protein [Candidatus Binatia bacterium]